MHQIVVNKNAFKKYNFYYEGKKFKKNEFHLKDEGFILITKKNLLSNQIVYIVCFPFLCLITFFIAFFSLLWISKLSMRSPTIFYFKRFNPIQINYKQEKFKNISIEINEKILLINGLENQTVFFDGKEIIGKEVNKNLKIYRLEKMQSWKNFLP